VNLIRTIIKYADIHGTFPWALPRARARVYFRNYRELWSKFIRYTNTAGREIRRTRSGITSITL